MPTIFPENGGEEKRDNRKACRTATLKWRVRQIVSSLMPSYGISSSIQFEQPTGNRATDGALRPQGLQAIMAQSVPVSVCLPMSASQEVLLNRMTSPPNSTDPTIIQAFAKIPALLEQNPGLICLGRFLDCDCLIGPIEQPFHAAIRAGRLVELTPAPVLMRSWRFDYCV